MPALSILSKQNHSLEWNLILKYPQLKTPDQRLPSLLDSHIFLFRDVSTIKDEVPLLFFWEVLLFYSITYIFDTISLHRAVSMKKVIKINVDPWTQFIGQLTIFTITIQPKCRQKSEQCRNEKKKPFLLYLRLKK